MNIKEVAIEMMKLLKLHPIVIDDFNNEHKINRSETSLALLYWLTEEEQEMVNEFEQKHRDTLVYHIIKTYTLDFGVVYDLLYVTANEVEWPLYREDLKDNLVLSYTVTEFAESGLIQIKSINGGLVRTS
jgi:hypothetical protein